MAAICKECGKEMKPGNGCSVEQYSTVPRIKFGDEKRFGYIGKRTVCHDCNVHVGQFHHPGCDWEECTNCGGQAIGCDCGG